MNLMLFYTSAALAATSFSMTGGSGTYSYEFARYEQAPNDIQEKEIAARASKVEGADE